MRLIIFGALLLQACGNSPSNSKQAQEECAYYYRDVKCKYYQQESSHLYACDDGAEYFGALGVRHICKQVTQ
jgi:hypothetical protein